ncbi:hypothetical protein F5Y18DRAFT_236215 [Xylariaceae sp. FL1019]|nr:hypothetical protein F5Y18DRAFT_236215 [Xylariaceae sp. FL1019]
MASQRLYQLSNRLGRKIVSSDAKMSAQPTSGGGASYKVLEQPIGVARHIRVVAIGAGASGINMIRTMRKRLNNFDLTVYEKNQMVGGTWFENRYPGCKCDIPSHNYQFSWSPNPEWRGFFSTSEEIEAYLCACCEKEKLYGAIKTSHQVVGARWVEDTGIWDIKVRNLADGTDFDDWCHFLLDCSGILNNWKWPDIPGLHDFHGKLVHSADWPKDFDYEGKVVAVIGNGSSGIQIVPAMQPKVKKLLHFARSPTWLAPPQLQMLANTQAKSVMEKIEFDDEGNFTHAQKARFKSDPALYKSFVKTIERETNGNFLGFTLTDSPSQGAVRAGLSQWMETKLANKPELKTPLIPDFPVGCRRITPGVGYLEALQAPNVHVFTGRVAKVVSNGIMTASGEILPVDAIVCATGFDVSFCPRFPIVGRKGNLQDIWSKELPRAYMSIAIPGLPNFFTFLGPNAPVGHGSLVTITEHIAKHVCSIVAKCQKQGIKGVSPSERAVAQLYEHIDVFMPRTTWAGSCSSWFKGGVVDGPVTALHPGSRLHFFDMLDEFRGEDWEYTYWEPHGNRFHYLGDGTSQKEFDGSDTTWYLDEEWPLD